MKVLVFDNYDSFTYNLVHLVAKILGHAPDVVRNDVTDIGKIDEYDKIILSPGPGIPDEAGLLKEVVRTYAPSKSMLGVCLGHQAIGEHFGGKLINLDTVYHGLSTPITVVDGNSRMFEGLPSPFLAGRYHSWILSDEGFPGGELKVTARDANGFVMAMEHLRYDVKGVQFHPESVLTPQGERIIHNWLKS